MMPPNHALAANPAIASRLQSNALMGRVAELGSFGKMSKLSRLSFAGLSVLPAVWMIWFVLQHLWKLYASDRMYSFGLHLNYGVGKLRDPWSDAMVLLCAIISVACGIAVGLDVKRKRMIAFVGGILLGIVI